MSNVTSWSTAIKRSKPSAPLSFLSKSKLLVGEILDFGCGRGDDLRYLQKKGYNIDGYDPHWGPKHIRDKEYDTIVCTYVLNVLPLAEMNAVISDIKGHLAPGGIAYLTVRRDISMDKKTSRGFQRRVELNLPVVKEKSGQYCMYKLELS